ncbi:MAG: PAS domain-containing protein [Gammaproteobacteria bacterium]|nr:PAS domain-containing protein [Gammaproteobacteria bacterium]
MGVPISGRLQALEDTFQTFNQLTETLETTYHSLEDRVAQLQSQLIDVQQKRRDEIGERDRIAKKLSSILHALPAGLIVLDSTGRIQDCNPAAIKLLGGPLYTEMWRDVISRSFAPRGDDGHDISLNDGRLVNISTCPLGSDPGQILLIADVTETRRLQLRLSQHQRLISMGEMVAGLAHQIRTPLSTALLSVSQLKSLNVDKNKQQAVVEKMIDQLSYLESLVNDMLLFSREEYCNGESFGLSQLISTLVEEAKTTAEKKQIVVEFDNPCDGVIVVGNQSILLSALQNLVNNAIQAIAFGGKITVAIRFNELDSVDIVITDTGPGISTEIQNKIFDPFFTTKSQGTGLGLSVVQAVTRAHQGDIWFDSDYQNGSRFVLRLPSTINNEI